MSTQRWKDYVILVLFLFIVWGFTFLYYGNGDVISHIGLASTLISIVLSVIAILYTLYQSVASSSQADRLTESSRQLSEASDRITESVHGLSSIQTQVGALTTASSDLSKRAEEVSTVAVGVQDLKSQIATLGVSTSTLMESVTRIASAVNDVDALKSQIAQSIESAVRHELAPMREDLGNLSKQLSNQPKQTETRIEAGDLKTKVSEASSHGLCVLYLLHKAVLSGSSLSFEALVEKVTYLEVEYGWGFLVGFFAGTPYEAYDGGASNFPSRSRMDETLGRIVSEEVKVRIDRRDRWIADVKAAINAIDWRSR